MSLCAKGVWQPPRTPKLPAKRAAVVTQRRRQKNCAHTRARRKATSRTSDRGCRNGCRGDRIGGSPPAPLPAEESDGGRGGGAKKTALEKLRRRRNNGTNGTRRAPSQSPTTLCAQGTVIDMQNGLPATLDGRHRGDGAGAVPRRYSEIDVALRQRHGRCATGDESTHHNGQIKRYRF